MSNFFIALKYNLINSLAINKLRKKNNPSKYSIGKIFLFIIFSVFLFLVSLLYAFMFGEAYKTVGQIEMILSLGIFFGVIMIVIFTITNASGYLFKSKDFDLLMSLPIKEKTVVFTKVSYILVINYIIFGFIYIPMLIVYAIYVETTFIFWILAIFTYLLLPLLPVSVTTMLAYLFSLFIPKFKYKNLFTIISSLFLIVLIMVLSFSSAMITEDPSGFTSSMNNILNKTGQWAFNGMRGDYLQYLYFVLVSIIPFLIFTKIIGMFYLKANTRFTTSSTKKDYKMGELKTTTQDAALIKKELKRYFNSPMYVLNTIVGPVLSTIMLVLLKVSTESTLEETGFSLNDIAFLPVILIASFVFTLGITSTTASSISIEGKQFWILKSLPVKPKQVFIGKVFVNLSITIPLLVVNTVLSIFFFDFVLIDYLMIFIIPSLFTVFMSYIGLYVNLLVPRFDYDSDVKAVKQSLSVMITMGLGFVFASIIIALGAFVLVKTNNNLYTYLVGLGLTLFGALGSMMLLYKRGSKIYNKIVI